MFNRAAECGYNSEREFLEDTFARFSWRWNGYVRRNERSTENIIRQLGGMLINVNKGAKSPNYKPKQDYPLSIDFVNDEYSPFFTLEKAEAMMKGITKAGWLN